MGKGAIRSSLAVLLLGVIVLASSGCEPPYTFTGNPALPTLLVMGDSIASSSAGAINDDLGTDHRVTISATVAKRIGEMQTEADLWAPADPRQVVIDLGTNDALVSWPVATSTNDLERMIATFPNAQCVVLVTVNRNMPLFYDHPLSGSWAASWDDLVLPLVAAGKPTVRIANWDRLLRDDVAAGSPEGTLLTDGIHPSLQGQIRLAALFRATLATCPTTSTGPTSTTAPPQTTTTLETTTTTAPPEETTTTTAPPEETTTTTAPPEETTTTTNVQESTTTAPPPEDTTTTSTGLDPSG